jgi:hypothetical protein
VTAAETPVERWRRRQAENREAERMALAEVKRQAEAGLIGPGRYRVLVAIDEVRD